MQRTRCYRLLTATLLVLAASAATAAPQGEYYGSGYTIISQAHGNDDLQATVYRQLAPGTVGQALPQLLDGTGWRLADRYAADDRIYRLYDQPLPEHKLRIGPMPLDQALTWIAGDGWALVVDPVNRLVSFEVEARYDARPPRSTARPPAPAHVTDNVDATTPVYADLPPQGTFPAVQTAPVSPAATYGASAYPLTVSSPPPASTESWQSALPQRLAASAQASHARRSPEARQVVRPATAEAKTASKTRVAATSASRRHDKTSAKSSDSAVPVQTASAQTAPAHSATATKTPPAQTADRAQPAAEKTPGKTAPAASQPTTKKLSVAAQDTTAAAPQAARQTDRKPPAPEKTPDPSAVKKAEAHPEKAPPAPENTAAQATAPAKAESAAPVLANPASATAATGDNHTADKPAAASAKAVKTVTAPHAAPADQPAPLPGAAPAEEWASNADLAGEVTRLQVKPPQNSSFAAYHVKDQGVQAVVPVKLALVGADPLSVAFLKKYHDRLQAEHFTVLLIGDADILRQFREAWPALEVQRFDLDNRLLLMLHVIGIRYYPALYDQGQVSP